MTGSQEVRGSIPLVSTNKKNSVNPKNFFFMGEIFLERYEHGGQIYDAAGRAGAWLDFSANINPLGLSKKILQTLSDNLRGVVNYPDPPTPTRRLG